MKIATWNINSVRIRVPLLTDWLKQTQVDVLCLQEIKCLEEQFPKEAVEDLGYNILVNGQKSYNGVAILSKHPLELVHTKLPDDLSSEPQARYLEALVLEKNQVVRVASIYLPNGNPPSDGLMNKGGAENWFWPQFSQSQKYNLKIEFMEALAKHAFNLLLLEEKTVLAGDYNIIPSCQDVYNPQAWRGDALFLPQSRASFRRILNQGWCEAFSEMDGAPHSYTFWDYQGGAWQKDHGIRIDHLLLSPQIMDSTKSITIDRNMRAQEKPSDHVPVILEIAD